MAKQDTEECYVFTEVALLKSGAPVAVFNGLSDPVRNIRCLGYDVIDTLEERTQSEYVDCALAWNELYNFAHGEKKDTPRLPSGRPGDLGFF